MKRPSLLSQIVGFNVLLVTASIFVAIVLSGLDLSGGEQRESFLLLVLAILLALVVNIFLLRRRLEPLERLLDTMEQIDLSHPGRRVDLGVDRSGDTSDARRLAG